MDAARHPGRCSPVLALVAAVASLTGCTQVVRYTDELVDPRYGRTLFTRLPATVGATAGFAIGVPLDIVAIPAAWVVYRSQPRETRDPVSVFLFPSFVLYRAVTDTSSSPLRKQRSRPGNNFERHKHTQYC